MTGLTLRVHSLGRSGQGNKQYSAVLPALTGELRTAGDCMGLYSI